MPLHRQLPFGSLASRALAAVTMLAAFAVAPFAVASPASADGADADPTTPEVLAQLARDAHAVFVARCAMCHQADSGHPVKGGFDHVLDLKRMSAEGKLVVPGDAAASDLWFTIEIDDMPPSDSPTGPMSALEKRVVREWIDAGAPPMDAGKVSDAESAASEADGATGAVAASPAVVPAVARPTGIGVVTLLGRAHVLAVHLPIALVFTALFAEALTLVRRFEPLRLTGTFAVWLGAIGAVASSVFGWIYIGEKVFLGERLEAITFHQWAGTGVTVLAVVAAALALPAARHAGGWRWAYRLTLIIAALGIGLVAHVGGESVHGADFLPF